MTFEAAVAVAAGLGYHTLGFCDHVHVAGITDWPAHAARLREYRALRDGALSDGVGGDLAGSPVKVLVGGEFEVQATGQVVECDEILEVCEYVVVAPNHYQLSWVESTPGTFAEVAELELDHIETALQWPHTDILAHPFAGTVPDAGHEPNGMWEAADKARVRALLDLALERGVALEIQPKLWFQPDRAGRVTELFDWWLDLGGRVALGSDAHTLVSLSLWARQYSEVVKRFSLAAERMWWPAPTP
jgi:histidinol phosphatase-like PHP family hydrolase